MSALATSPIEVRQLRHPDELSECSALYGRVFAPGAADASINVRLLVAIASNSGIVIGAHADGRLIGFVYSFLALDRRERRLYQYSQTAVVEAGWRGQGVGRALKLAQRDAALEQDITIVRWLFDPLHVANAHFNLDVLGGVGVRLQERAYGDYGTPADAGEPTDRLLIEWRLQGGGVDSRAAGGSRPTAPQPPALRVGETRRDEDGVLLAVPADWPSARAAPGGRSLRTKLIGRMQELLADRLFATSCVRIDRELAVYRFAPAESEVVAR